MDNTKGLNPLEVAKDILLQALTKGYFTLPDSNEVRELNNTQLLQLARIIVKEGISLDNSKPENNNNLPSEMFSYEDQDSKLVEKVTYEERKEVFKEIEDNVKLLFLDLDDTTLKGGK